MKKGKNNFLNNKSLLYGIFSLPVITMILLINGCGEEQAGGGEFAMPPMPVEVAEVIKQKVSDKFEAVGTIQAMEEITVVSEIDAVIISLPFEEGSYIKKGQVIAQLDDEQLSAEVLRAEALYEQTKSAYNRIKSVVEQKAGTPQDLDDAFASLKVAESNLVLAKSRFAKTRITAPFDGMIGARRVSVGTFLRTGEVITTLANLNTIRVTFSVSEKFLSQLKRGAEVTVTSPTYPDHIVKGRIIAIEPVLDPQTRNVQVVAKVENPGQKFRSGMSANVSAVLNERPDALTIPNEAVFANGNQSFVYVVQADSTVNQVAITSGLQLSDVIEISEGLEEGMRVVKAGHQKLFPGAKVFPVNSQQQENK